MKKVLYIHQYFKTPEEGGAIRSYYIARGLVERGYRVDMITSHNEPGFLSKNVDGISVHYLPVYYSNELSARGRYLAFLKFAIRSIIYISKLPTPNLAYVTSTPLTVGIIALWLRRFRGIPYIFEVRDLWPEAPIQLGAMRSWVLMAMAKRLEKRIYKKSSSIVALSPGIKHGIVATGTEIPVSIIPNMADLDFYQKSRTVDSPKGGVVVGYFGAMGRANGLMSLIQAAEVCRDNQLAVSFILMGDGSEADALSRLITEKNLDNMRLLPAAGKERVAEVMCDVDACMVSFLKVAVLETCSPNKFFDALAAGKLCIVNTAGWLKELVEENRCGFYYDPAYPESFAKQIEHFITDRKLLVEYQQNAADLGFKQFSRDRLVEEVCRLISNTPVKSQ